MTKPIKKQVWNNIDAFALLNGISTWDNDYKKLKYVRLPGETTLELRSKINRIQNNPPTGLSKQDLINGLSNELLFDTYNIIEKNTFTLSYNPYPSGELNTQDIWVSYQPPNDSGWYPIIPQNWITDVSTSGFIVYENALINSIETTKNFTYSNILKILSEIPDQSKLKILYYRKLYNSTDSDLFLFTDISNDYNINDDSFIYRKCTAIDSGFLQNHISAYTLFDIPSGLNYKYYNNEYATDYLYKIKDYIDVNYKHKWDNVSEGDYWDLHKNYGRGTIPSYYDSYILVNSGEILENNLSGGVEKYSRSLYLDDFQILNESGIYRWYPVLYPGKFYVNGYSYYLFENMNQSTISFINGSGILPNNIERFHKVLLTTSDISISGFISQDYVSNLPISDGNTYISSGVLRQKPYLNSNKGINITLNNLDYCIDYDNSIIYASGVSSATLIWDNILIPSGKLCNIIDFDINPTNNTNLFFNDYFIYIKEV